LGQRIGPIFNGQEVQEENDAAQYPRKAQMSTSQQQPEITIQHYFF
jgi:hypothetical protein